MITSCLDKIFMRTPPVWEYDSPERIAALIQDACHKYDLDPPTVAAIIFQESRGNVWAFRFEPKFFEKNIKNKSRSELSGYVPLGIPTLASEKRLRSSSFGLMQILGETARWRGYRARYLTSLFVPRTNIDVGCNYLRFLLNQTIEIEEKEQYRDALTRYNGSGNYPDIVFGHVGSEAYRKILYPGEANNESRT